MKQAERKIVKEWSRQQMQANRQETLRIAFLGLLNVGVGMVQIHALASFLAALLLQQKHILAHALIVFAGTSLLRMFLGFLQEMTALSAGQTARRRLRSVILARIQAIGPSLLREHHSSIIAELLVERIEALEGYFSRWLPASTLYIIAQWSVVLVVLWENRRAGIILALCCLLLPVFQAVFGLATAITSQRQFLAMSRLQTRFLDRVKGIATLVLSGNIESEIQALSDSAEELRKRTMRVLRVAFLASATTDVTMTVALVGIVISQAHILYHTNSLPLATKALFAVLVVPEAFAPFRALSAAYQDRAQAQATAEAMHKLPEKHLNQSKERISASHSPALLSPGQNGISLSVQGVSYYWAEDRPPALSHVSFNLEAGQIMILEGASGSGKSTLIELVLGFVSPRQGRILLQGVDTTQLSSSDKMQHMSWIGQKPVLFAGSLRDNVLFARPDASETELKDALDAAHVSAYLSLLPQGLETIIGEGGFGLSGGQAQRIAIARAYLKNAPLLLLDEPTAHLDPETEADLLLSLQKLLKGRTALISTHSTQYDKIDNIQKMRLEKGQIIKNSLSGKNM